MRLKPKGRSKWWLSEWRDHLSRCLARKIERLMLKLDSLTIWTTSFDTIGALPLTILLMIMLLLLRGLCMSLR